MNSPKEKFCLDGLKIFIIPCRANNSILGATLSRLLLKLFLTFITLISMRYVSNYMSRIVPSNGMGETQRADFTHCLEPLGYCSGPLQ